ncbi:titin homolog isoform X2 [Elgaria multicarinata webbii]|uniref:titin homolog isoform X2 n=1 Tax=Elgaria multicarinata webbii TaxID=159646 RepID=UPI002FCCD4CC
MEGSALSMECRIEGNLTSKWSIDWHRNKTDGRGKLQNSDRTRIMTDINEKFSRFTLEKAALADSGTYLCSVVNLGIPRVFSNGTQVIISEITDWMVNQTPGHLEKVEGANVTIECRFRTVGNSSMMYVKWCKEGLEEELANRTGSRAIAQDLEKGFASLTLMDAHEADSGSYRCVVGSRSRNQTGSGIETRVVITAAKLLVHQTPALFNGTEGEELTIKCNFAVKDPKRQYNVTWYKDAVEVTEALFISAEGLASLIFKKVKMEDSGTYTCVFGHHGQGNGTMVKVFAQDKQLGATVSTDVGVGAGVGAGILVLLLLISALVWRWKRRAKGTSVGTTEAESIPAKELRKHPPLTDQASEVMYASLNFSPKEVQPPAGEVIYAEVRTGSKQRGGNGRRT